MRFELKFVMKLKKLVKVGVNCCIYRYMHGYVVIVIFEFGEYCFIK